MTNTVNVVVVMAVYLPPFIRQQKGEQVVQH